MNSVRVKDVVAAMNQLAPPHFALQGDKIGLQVGHFDAKVQRVWVALEATPAVVDAAVEAQVHLIVTHHALLFRPLAQIDTGHARERAIARLLANEITVFSAHTNLDVAPGGVNDVIAEKFGLLDVEILDVTHQDKGTAYGIGRIGMLPKPMRLTEFVHHVRTALSMPHIRFAGDGEARVERVAVLGGSGSKWVEKSLAKGADVLVTADVGHHDAADAWQDGLAVIDATHAALEQPVCGVLVKRLQTILGSDIQIEVAPVQVDPFHWL